MKRIALFVIFITCIMSVAWGITLIVDAAGTGDATTIQGGIDLSVSGDTVLVHDGIYQGEIIIDNKMINLASYYITDGDTTHITNTIIDGENIRTGIKVLNCRQGSEWIQITGFSICNCRSDWVDISDQSIGGGVAVYNSMLRLTDNLLYYCRAYYGGGLGTYSSFVHLSNNSIFHNSAIRYGGGIASYLSTDNQIAFDQTRLNSVFLNHAGGGSDIACSIMNYPIIAYLKYGTINYVDEYYYAPSSQFTLFVQYPLTTQVQSDLWVSPYGCDDNSGLNSTFPLQTLTYAIAKANPDSLHPITIHLMPGIYKWSDTRQPYPIQLKSYLTIEGSSRDQVILDAEGYGSYFQCLFYRDNFYIKNLTCINGRSLLYGIWFDIWQDDIAGNSVGIENVTIRDTWCVSDLVRISSYKNVSVYGLVVQNCQNHTGLFIDAFTYARVENCIVQNNAPSYYDWPQTSSCGIVLTTWEQHAQYHAKIEVINCLINDNRNDCTFWGPLTSGLNINVSNGNGDLDVINCTIANNVSIEPHTAGFAPGGVNYRINVFNTLISGNSPYEVGIFTTMDADSAIVAFDHCLVTGGENSLYHVSGLGTSLWLDGNLYNYPVYDTTSQYSYYPDITSPTRDAGSLDLPGDVIIPEYDLAGNPRIYNDAIDIGCYEWNGTAVQDNSNPMIIDVLNMKTYPNPFITDISIEYYNPVKIEIDLSVYNLKGQLIKTLAGGLTTKGTHKETWNGTNGSGKTVSAGIYLVRLEAGGKQITRKVVLIR